MTGEFSKTDWSFTAKTLPMGQSTAVSISKTATKDYEEIYNCANSEQSKGEQPQDSGSDFSDVKPMDAKAA